MGWASKLAPDLLITIGADELVFFAGPGSRFASTNAQLEAALVDGGNSSFKEFGSILVKHFTKKGVLFRSPGTKLTGTKATGNSSFPSLDADSPDRATKLAGQLVVGHC